MHSPKKVIFTDVDYNLLILTANKTTNITNLTKYELSQGESDLLKAG